MVEQKKGMANFGDVLIIGLGVSGKAVAKYLLDQQRFNSLTIYAGKQTPEALEWSRSNITDPNVDVVFDTEDIEGAYDLCIASPGISEFSEFYMNAKHASKEIISEVEFAWRESDVQSIWVAITGTNGKTTTTALTGHLLKSAGKNVDVVGNIGDAAISAVGKNNAKGSHESPTIYVVEASSFQLASTKDFAPNVAIVLGITPDHIAWHKTHENYAEAKWKVFANLKKQEGSVAILDATNDEVRQKVRELKALSDEERAFEYVPIGTREGVTFDMRQACGSKNAAFVDNDGNLIVALNGTEHDLANKGDMQLNGDHNSINALAAASAAVALGIEDELAKEALCTFRPLEHRIEPSGEVDGVAYYNDSKATNVDATLVALSAFLPKKPIVMFGGRDKGTDLQPLVDACRENVSCAICFGEAGERFYDALSVLEADGVDIALIPTFDEAFALAHDKAQDGDVVLLSPACASFDEFSCFEERGEHFKELVAALQ